MLAIITAPNEVLAKVAKPIHKVDKTTTVLIADMKETLDATHDPEGVGLAAPQVGTSVQLFIMKPSASAATTVIINPKIISRTPHKPSKEEKKNKGTKLEGCLSLPTIWGIVVRDESLVLSYMDELGDNHTKTFTGFPAVIIQHEIDHLQGILFPKRVLEQENKLYKSVKDKKDQDVFEEIEM